MSIIAVLEPNSLDAQLETEQFTSDVAGAGAVVTFLGIVRTKSELGDTVDALFLEHHRTLTRRSLEEIAAACAERFDVTHVRVVHRSGTVHAGEPIVFVGASAAHRRAALDAVDYLMDRLKTDAVFWKRELSGQNSRWIAAQATDYAWRDRWA